MTLMQNIRVLVAHALTVVSRFMRRVDPDHGGGCGCPQFSHETGLYDPNSTLSYDTDYPFFVCPECWHLTPWCKGCGGEDAYTAEVCDDCRDKLWGVDRTSE